MTQIPAAWMEHDKSIRPYKWSHRAVGIARSLLGLFVVVYCLKAGTFQAWETHLGESIHSLFPLWLAYFGTLMVAWEVITLPLSIFSQGIEKHFKLSKQSYGSWFWDRIKGYLLGAVLGALVMGLIHLCVMHLGPFWWAGTCTLLVFLSIVLAQLAPVLFIPLFFKLKPMEGGTLKERLLKLSEKYGVTVSEVYHLGLGEKTEKGNAAFVGMGKTKRIIIGDTLYEKFSPEEVEAVFAHELGHQVHNDLWKGIIFSAVIMYVTFFLADYYLNSQILFRFETSLERPFGLLLFFVVLSVINVFTGFTQSMFSRWRERRADEFAKLKSGSGEKLADALERLTYQNRGQFKPNAVVEFFTYSHPSPWRRILWLRQ